MAMLWGAIAPTPTAPVFLGDTLPPPALDASPPSNANIVIAIDAEPATLNVLLDPIEPWAQEIGSLIFDSLVQPDPSTGQDVPHLAQSWSESADHLTLTFVLRRDRTWDDNEPFTADDVIFTFDTLLNPATRAGTLRTYLSPLASYEKLDPYTVRFHLKRASVFAFAAISQTTIFPKHVYMGGDFNNHPANRTPVGSHQFRFSRWQGGDKIVLTRNDSYKGNDGPAGAAQITFKIVPDPVKRLTLLRSGAVDIIERLNPTLWLQASRAAPINTHFWRLRHVPSELQAIGWNNKRPYFANAQVRRALTMLIDRTRLVNTLRGGVDTVAASWFYPNASAYNPSLEPWPYAPTGAKTLLTESGWVDHDGDGVRDQAGVPFAFELIFPSGNAFYAQLASALSLALADADIRVTPVALPWAAYMQRLTQHGFDACLFLWDMAPDSDPYPVWHSTAAYGGANYVNFADPEADALLEEARQTFDSAARNAVYRHFSEVLHREEPATFLFNRYHLSFVNKRLSGVASNPYGVLRLERLFIPQAAAPGGPQ